jgi:hypothetical protein
MMRTRNPSADWVRLAKSLTGGREKAPQSARGFLQPQSVRAGYRSPTVSVVTISPSAGATHSADTPSSITVLPVIHEKRLLTMR